MRVMLLQVRRAAAFKDSLKQALLMRLLDQVAGGMVLYPSFTDAASPRTPPAETSGREALPCKRQDFFEHAGRQMLEGGDSQVLLVPVMSGSCLSRAQAAGQHTIHSPQWSHCMGSGTILLRDNAMG